MPLLAGFVWMPISEIDLAAELAHVREPQDYKWSDAAARRFKQRFWTDYERVAAEYLLAYADLVAAYDTALHSEE